jgi:hypothetical protein
MQRLLAVPALVAGFTLASVGSLEQNPGYRRTLRCTPRSLQNSLPGKE